MIAEMKELHENHKDDLQPNRKTGTEVDSYFKQKYPYQIYESVEFRKIVESNIMENAYSRKKLKNGMSPDIRCYRVGDVFVGIDIVSGEFHIECEDIGKAVPIYDDLFVYRGLDEDDLTNFFLVAEYIKLTKQ